MKAIRVIALFLAVSLLLSGCGSGSKKRQAAKALKEEKKFTEYREDHQVLLQQIAEEFLQLHHSLPKEPTVQLYVGNESINFFRGDVWNREALAGYGELSGLIAQLQDEKTSISLICADDSEQFFSGATCAFQYSLHAKDVLFYNLSLFYCEEANPEVKSPEITTKLADHWYLVGYGYN